MEELRLQAAAREVLGKKTRFLRRKGITPTHLFGHGISSLTLQCDAAQLQRLIDHAGKTRLLDLDINGDKTPRKVIIREIQRDPCTGQPIHVDFYQVRVAERIKVDVPIILVGESPAAKFKGTVLQNIDSLTIECLPDELLPSIEVDISLLEDVGQAIHVKDIKLNQNITVITDSEEVVVKIAERFREKVEEVAIKKEVEVTEEAAKEEAEEE